MNTTKTPDSSDDEMLKLSDAERRLLDKSSLISREQRLYELLQELQVTRETTQHKNNDLHQAEIRLEIAGLQLDLDDRENAWQNARSVIDTFIEQQKFEDAALAAQYVYLCNREDAISAIGQAAWLSVTYPVSPQLTANILDHIIDETPDKSDGAAVAAATAQYVADLRCVTKEQEPVKLFTGSMLARVARRHSKVENKAQFEQWVQQLELDNPARFLVRLRNVVDVMVQEDWWFDRDKLTSALPEHDSSEG